MSAPGGEASDRRVFAEGRADGMDWNNDALYDPVPVTVRCAKVLARTIANVPSLRREVYPYRLFM